MESEQKDAANRSYPISRRSLLRFFKVIYAESFANIGFALLVRCSVLFARSSYSQNLNHLAGLQIREERLEKFR